ncbi:acyl-coenzyme A thioesterase 13 isoform X3 [Suricata suricatta]|uniref:acyl-coenzyme A thioesterase 13 isoform X3 n=1 Tax=Suricata suricatta TaxID=37032 RepID=UPI001156060B|nr:acyl-coenzyme A thioesterase 13 isoform X3 [Suricata suricatta]
MNRLTPSALELMKAVKNSRRFDRVLEKVTLVSAGPGKVICEMKVGNEHSNNYGTLHGGMTATLVDNISTLALVSTERGLPGVSVDMNITEDGRGGNADSRRCSEGKTRQGRRQATADLLTVHVTC